uniref:Uncharacterized protein n=1 Tax=Arundo donax TaxID=35708 RepID=A0A0A9HED6_ARUDO
MTIQTKLRFTINKDINCCTVKCTHLKSKLAYICCFSQQGFVHILYRFL